MVDAVALVHDTGHYLLGNHTVVLPAVNHVVETAALCELYVTVQTYGCLGAVLHSLVDYEHLGQVMLALAQTEQLGLKETY